MSAKTPAVVIGVGAVGVTALVIALAASQRTVADTSKNAPEVSSADIEALGRMLASENPKGSIALWVQQCWTQIRSLKRGQSLYHRITGGKGFGAQNRYRPVATTEPASALHRMVARLVLVGSYVAQWDNARKFFEPRQQDAMFRVAEAARAKHAQGMALTAKETRSLGYEKDAAGIRREWASEGARYVGLIEGVEFWT